MGIIILSGRARSGKNTFAKFLQKHLKEEYYQVAYATYLKMMCREHFDLTNAQLYGDLKEVPDKRYPRDDGSYWTPREIMQHMGTEAFRAVDSKFWINKLFYFIDRHNFKNIIITDARFGDEVAVPVSRGGIHVRIERDHDLVVHGKEHPSETSLDDCDADFIIQNTGTLEDLEDMAKQLIEEIENYGRKTKTV